LGPEGIEVDFVIAPGFEVFEPLTSGQEVIGDGGRSPL
jgi:hypothetical protein